ncbi:MAG TPA: thioredoxin domain-containing protein [Thermoplasmata archaeon]|nr:thioredoxin domain-containing protein [Thermoplasmata archaeon]
MGKNRLAQETSTYLKGAAHQPVDWLPWGDEAFRKAKELDRPILLDIGATWCHWCHVIDRESYEDAELAKVINENFVAIKVDRDERPDIDARYQQAVGAISGSGGWPLTAFLTPDGKVFYGGTYFPPKDAYGRPSFRRVLLAMSESYRTNKADTMREADALHQALVEGRPALVEEGVVNEAMLKESLDGLRGQFDPVNGGISGTQKFPHAGTMDWIMARYHRTRESGLRTIFTRTLTSMARGGVYDQVGGGFHRYSTDPQWIVPHFEKMLYDNAGLLANNARAWQLTNDPLYRETAEGILAWTDEVLTDRSRGGYYASQDADVGLDDDGDYFTWTLDELNAAVGKDEARVLALLYEVGERGEMRHNPRKNVLYLDQEIEAISKSTGIPAERVRFLVASGKRQLKAARDKRSAPAVDPTIFASWNGMMIAAALEAALAFGREDIKSFALKSLGRIIDEMWSPDQGMWHALSGDERKVRGLLEDHVYMTDALLAAYAATADPAHLRKAEDLMAFTLKHFWDKAGGFVDVASDLHDGIGLPLKELRRRPVEDSPYAGANAVAALCLQRLHALTGNDDYRLHHDELMIAFAGEASRYGPVFTGTYHLAAELWIHPPAEIVILGPRDDARTRGLQTAATGAFSPGKTVLVVEKEDAYVPPLIEPMRATREAKAGPVAFVCQGNACSRPTAEPGRLRELLAGPPAKTP